jgi:NTP pyrophosphatase (non-canonical NTP hydrolase)
MIDAHTRPSEAQLERLAILAEECGEVQRVIGKILRHGWRNHGYCNRIGLEHEIGDVIWSLRMLIANDDVSANAIERFAAEKPERAAPYLHHNHAVPTGAAR